MDKHADFTTFRQTCRLHNSWRIMQASKELDRHAGFRQLDNHTGFTMVGLTYRIYNIWTEIHDFTTVGNGFTIIGQKCKIHISWKSMTTLQSWTNTQAFKTAGEKFCIRETLNLSACADRSNDLKIYISIKN